MNDVAKTPEPAAAETVRRVYRPLADVVETDDAVVIMLEMPGVPAEDVEIEFENGVLNVRGRAAKPEPENYQLVHAEYEEGDYERAFSLSDELDPDKIEASMKNGVLVLTLPRTDAARPKRIEVKRA